MNQLYVYIYPLLLELPSHPHSPPLQVLTEHQTGLPVLTSLGIYPGAELLGHMVRSLAGYSPWVTESDTAEWLIHTHKRTHIQRCYV